MPRQRCRFCAHDNPEGARFCNDCGSPLHLRPCPACDGVNDDAASHCFQCGFRFEGDRAESELIGAAPASAGATVSGDRRLPTERPQRILDALADRLEAGAHPGAGVDTFEPQPDLVPRPGPDPDAARPVPVARHRERSTWIAASIALAAIALGGYLAYRSAAPTVSPSPAVAPPAAPGGAQTPSPPMAADATTPSEPPAAVSPVTADAPSAEPADDPSATSLPSRPGSADAPRKSAGAAAVETNRIIQREMGVVGPRDDPSANPPRDRAALETDRLVEREMGTVAPSRAR